MLKVHRETQDQQLVLKLEGTIDERDNLDALFANLPAEAVIQAGGVIRINSMGVRAWIKAFTAIAASGTQVILRELSPALVEQINLVPVFRGNARIESVQAPFVCDGCGHELRPVFDVAAIRAFAGDVPAQSCPKCGANASFDDIADEYFAFMDGL